MTLTKAESYHVVPPGASVPRIEIHPTAELVVDPNASATFDSWAVGQPAPTVQWEMSTDDGDNWSPIEGATAATYVIDAISDEDGNLYHAVWTNDEGSATSNESLVSVTGAL